MNFNTIESGFFAISADSPNAFTYSFTSSVVNSRQVTPGKNLCGILEGATATFPTIDGILTRPKPADNCKNILLHMHGLFLSFHYLL